MPKDGQIKEYPRNIDADLLELWNRCRVTGDTTKTKILRKLEQIEKNTSSGGGSVWAWAKKVLSFASSEASKIRIE